jgi:signal transduction histidine kinase/CheY-like chemotaxis protein
MEASIAETFERRELERARARIAELEALLEASLQVTERLRESAARGVGSQATERRRVEEAHHRSEERGRIAAEAARMGFWSWEAADDVLVLDKTSAAMLGWPPFATRTSFRRCLEAIHPEDHPRLEEAARVFSAHGVLEDLEVRAVLPGGALRWLLVSGKRGAGDDGEPVVLIGSLFDVTQRRMLEEQLRQAQKMEAVGELTAGIAHNFNNLLTAIIPSIQLARREAIGVAGERLRDAEYAASRAAELVRELMVFARRDETASTASVDVRELVQRTVTMCRATFDRSVDIDVVSEGQLPAVIGEGGRLEQVFLNICLNARDALESSGRKERGIRIELDTAADGANAVARAARDWVRVRISDNGTGMPEDVRARIFEPFFTTKEVGRGTGLGLATAYAIVRDHGGRLSCDSRFGVGTTFTILLPSSGEIVASSGVVSETHPGGTETVLVIDDERLVRSAVRGVLEPMGYTVREAPDGESGFELFQRERDHIDLILLDMSMPGVGGKTLLANIRAEAPAAKVVLFTGYRPPTAPEGAARMLQKPFELEELLCVVREVCDASRDPARAAKT